MVPKHAFADRGLGQDAIFKGPFQGRLICRHQDLSPGPRAGQIPRTSRGPSGQLGDQRENDQTDERNGAPCPIVTTYQRASAGALDAPHNALRSRWNASLWPAGGTSPPGVLGTFGNDRRSRPVPPTRPALRGPPASTQLALDVLGSVGATWCLRPEVAV